MSVGVVRSQISGLTCCVCEMYEKLKQEGKALLLNQLAEWTNLDTGLLGEISPSFVKFLGFKTSNSFVLKKSPNQKPTT